MCYAIKRKLKISDITHSPPITRAENTLHREKAREKRRGNTDWESPIFGNFFGSILIYGPCAQYTDII